MPDELFINSQVSIPESEFEIATSRSGGPGGQHVNKTSSRVSLRWNVATTTALTDAQRERVMKKLASKLTLEGDLIIHVDTTRSQIMNRQIAQERLAELVKDALVVPKRRVATKPSKAAKTRRIQSKKKTGQVKVQRRGSFDDD